MLRYIIAAYQLFAFHESIKEHSYKSWVKTFDETGSLVRSDRLAEEEEGDGVMGIGMRQRDIVALAAGMGFWACAVLVPGMGYLLWMAMAVMVEVGGLGGVRKLWRRKGVRRPVKGWLKKRGWW